MLLYILTFIAGVAAGTFTGLTPGIHTNIVTASLITLPILSTVDPIIAIIFITTLAITHTFVDFIPSTYFSAPDEDTVTNILVGHRFLKNRLGHNAVCLTVVGSILGIICLLIITPLFLVVIPKIYDTLSVIMSPLLIILSVLLITKERESVLWAILIFCLSGILGIVSSSSNINQPLLPLLTGLFGSSALIHSVKSAPIIPMQKTNIPKIKKELLKKPFLSTIIVSPICSLLPGVGTAQAATISGLFFRKTNSKEYLILTGSINTLVVATSFLILFLINKTRTGAAVAISSLSSISIKTILIIHITIIITTIPATIITVFTSKTIAKNIHKINYSIFSIFILFLLIVITLYVSGFSGLLILIVGTLLGLLTIKTGIRRTHLMGAILLPTILFYLIS